MKNELEKKLVSHLILEGTDFKTGFALDKKANIIKIISQTGLKVMDSNNKELSKKGLTPIKPIIKIDDVNYIAFSTSSDINVNDFGKEITLIRKFIYTPPKQGDWCMISSVSVTLTDKLTDNESLMLIYDKEIITRNNTLHSLKLNFSNDESNYAILTRENFSITVRNDKPMRNGFPLYIKPSPKQLAEYK